MGQGGPLFLNLEGGIPIKRDVVEKNKITPYCIVCKKKTLKIIFGYVVP